MREIAFIRLKSYEGTSTTGNVKQVLGLTENIEGRHVIVVGRYRRYRPYNM